MLPGLVLLGILLCCPAAAGSEPQGPGIFGTDDRVMIDGRSAPWSAVGRVNVGGFRRVRHCTGTLVAPRLVVTAAHCLVDPGSGRPESVGNIHFVAGIHLGEHSAHAGVACVRFVDGYRDGPADLKRRIDRDAALLVLDRPLTSPPIAVDTGGRSEPGQPLLHASFPRNRPHALSLQRSCRLLANRRGLWLTDCDTNFGGSGGPVLVERNGEVRLAAIMVGIQGPDGSVALSMPVWESLLAAPACP